MKMMIITALLISATPAQAAPLSEAQAGAIRCVAALAIVASDQVRGAGDWRDFPPVAKRGATYAGIVEEQVMKGAALTREAVRALIFSDVAALQQQPEAVDGVATACLPLIDAAVPPPGLPRCAAIVALARDDVRAREGLSDTAKMLTTFAAVLDSRARDQLRADGKSESESDIVMGLAREAAAADAKASKDADFDLETCFDLARP